MHKLEDLKEMLCEELEKYGEKELTAGSLDVVDKLAHAVKNIDKIIEGYDDGYSGRSYARDGRGRDGRGRDGRSYRGSYAQRRDAMGRYSREDYSMAMAEDLRDMMKDAPDQQTRQEIQRIVSRLEQM